MEGEAVVCLGAREDVRVRICMYSYRHVSAHLIASGRSLVLGGEGVSAYVCIT